MILLGLLLGAAIFLFRPRGKPSGVGVSGQFSEIYKHWGRQFDIEPELLQAIAIRESRENPRAIGRNLSLFPDDWDYGLMQINAKVAPVIASRLGHYDFRREHLMIPNVSVRFAAWLLNDNRRISGNGDRAAMASAYNWGLRSGRVVVPFPNQGYVNGVLEEWQRLT